MDRRELLCRGGLASLAWSLGHHLAAEEPAVASPPPTTLTNPVIAFSKFLTRLSFEELSDRIAEAGYNGIEATVRRGGIVRPEEASVTLPQLAAALAKNGLTMPIMTSDIGRADAESERLLKLAVDNGVTHVRLAYDRYDLKTGDIKGQLESFRVKMEHVAAMCARVGVVGLVQNHAGAGYVGATLWDADHVLEGIDPDHVGVVFDLRHAIIEAGQSWPVLWAMIRPRVRALYVKDARWDRDRVVNVPLGEGRVPASFFRDQVEPGWPISVHVEYEESVPSDTHVGYLARDRRLLASWIRAPRTNNGK